jgi:16S rRNA (guanine966-N2)-methyltransferase
MRIISGNKKGKKILLPDQDITRPLKDSVKENIFNILLHSQEFKYNFDFNNSIVFDIFAGSGSFGMECLSRGSRFCLFVENNNSTHNILYRNLSNNFEKNKFEILKKDFFNIDFQFLIQKYNPTIIFFDPPYELENIDIAFEKIFKSIENFSKIYFIAHIKKNKKLKSNNLINLQERIYGLSKIIFMKSKN